MRILLLEDDIKAAQAIVLGLSELGHDIRWLTDRDAAVRHILAESFDAAIFDRMIPGNDGLAALRAARAAGSKTPVLMLTALGGIEDRIEGLESGADDYMTKPYAFSELVARLQALARRPSLEATTVLAAGDIEMNLMRYEVRRAGRRVTLQPREYRLLEELLRHSDQIVTKRMLLERVWNFSFDPRTSVVETLVSRLRVKLNDGFDEDAIRTIRGVGYQVRTDF